MKNPSDESEKGIPLPSCLAAVWGAFLFEGLLSYPDVKRNEQVLDTWGQGCIELVITACAFLPEVWAQISTTWESTDADLPGVFEYEVLSPLGEWLASYLLEHNGQMPPPDTVRQTIQELIDSFFHRKPDEQAA